MPVLTEYKVSPGSERRAASASWPPLLSIIASSSRAAANCQASLRRRRSQFHISASPCTQGTGRETGATCWRSICSTNQARDPFTKPGRGSKAARPALSQPAASRCARSSPACSG